jgi:hypothetical protein
MDSFSPPPLDFIALSSRTPSYKKLGDMVSLTLLICSTNGKAMCEGRAFIAISQKISLIYMVKM